MAFLLHNETPGLTGAKVLGIERRVAFTALSNNTVLDIVKRGRAL